MVTGEKRQQLSWFLTLVIVAIVSFVAGARSDALFANVASGILALELQIRR